MIVVNLTIEQIGELLTKKRLVFEKTLDGKRTIIGLI